MCFINKKRIFGINSIASENITCHVKIYRIIQQIASAMVDEKGDLATCRYEKTKIKLRFGKRKDNEG